MKTTSAAREQAIVIDCAGESLLGIVHHPPADAPETTQATGVVVVVGGPQYRVGSHRQFVHLARTLAAAGHAVLRFDVQGMGDSSGALRSFEAMDGDIRAAIEVFSRCCPGVRRIVLWGLCDGASANLLYVARQADPSVAGLVLLNPWVRTSQGLARAQLRHYYGHRLKQPQFWRKLFRGDVGWAAVREWFQNRRAARANPAPPPTPHFTARMAEAMRTVAGPILLILSGDDLVAKEFIEHAATNPEWHNCLQRAALKRVDLQTANHTFSAPSDTRAVELATLDWLITTLSGSPFGNEVANRYCRDSRP